MTAIERPKQYYLVVATMLLALMLLTSTHQIIWDWLTRDLRDGLWVCQWLAASVSIPTDPDPHLVGVEGRFVWGASTLFLLAAIVGLIAVSAFTVVTAFHRWRPVIAAAAVLALGGVLVAKGLLLEPGYSAYALLSSTDCGSGVADAGNQAFQFGRYLILILEPYYGADFLDSFTLFEQFLPTLVLLCNIFLIAALLALILPSLNQSQDADRLGERFAQYRLLLLLGSALFTAIALYYLSQYAWISQVLAFTNEEAAAQLRGIQTGVTLFLGTTNSLAMILLFLPSAWILSDQAMVLSRAEVSADSRQARSEWLAQRQLTILSGPTIRVVTLTAPLLFSGAAMLLEKFWMGI